MQTKQTRKRSMRPVQNRNRSTRSVRRRKPLDMIKRRSHRAPELRLYLGSDEIIVDNFAGGGGASTGVANGLGVEPTIAINHDPEAIAMHKANHPSTEHHVEDVYKVDPRKACAGRPVAFAWFSPDCKHHSKAKGGKPRNAKIRGLAWVAVRWAHTVRPRVIALENVEEFLDWGPISRDTGLPVPERKGQTFRAFVRRLEKLGYVVEWKLLRACDYGAPTTRRRLFLVARCDGRAIRWPEPTHGPTRDKAHRPAAEIIDWSVACPSIFERERPLADKTLARIARGIRKYVLDNPRPFIVSTAHGGVGRNDLRVSDGLEPMRTITGGQRGDHAIVVPYLVHRSNGERVGQAPRIYDIERPVGTIVAQGQKHAVCAALLIKHYSDRPTGGCPSHADIEKPASSVTARDHHSLVEVSLVPADTVDGHRGAVSAFLVRYNGTSEAQTLDKPAGTLTTKDRYALITVTIGGEEYVLVDIGMRMLTPRELYRAQGFPEAYKIDPPGPSGKTLTKTAQIRMCGNSVCPPLASAIARAQFQEAS